MLSPSKFVGVWLIGMTILITVLFVFRPQYNESCGSVDSIKMVHPAGSSWGNDQWTVIIDNTTYWFYEDSILQTFQSAQHFNATVKITFSNDFQVQSVKIQEC